MKLNLKNISNWLHVSVASIASIVIVGWVFDIDVLTRVSQNQINIKFVTAVIFVITAISMIYISQILKGKKDLAQVVLPATSMTVLLIMFTLLASGVFGVSTGLENIFVAATPSIQNNRLGMPAIPTIINFVIFGLLSVAALFIGSKTIQQLLAAVGYCFTGLGTLAVLGYIFDLPYLYWKFNNKLTPIALYTSILFILLGLDMIITSKIKYKKQNYED